MEAPLLMARAMAILNKVRRSMAAIHHPREAMAVLHNTSEARRAVSHLPQELLPVWVHSREYGVLRKVDIRNNKVLLPCPHLATFQAHKRKVTHPATPTPFARP